MNNFDTCTVCVDGFLTYHWTVEGFNVKACIADIQSNQRTEATGNVLEMFRQRYSCAACLHTITSS